MKKKAVVFLSILLLILINNLITPPLGYSFLTPCLPIVGVIYWYLNKKYLINNYYIFVLGLINDLVVGTPLGSSSILYFMIKIFISFLEKRIINRNVLFIIIKTLLGISAYYLLIYLFIIIFYNKYPSISYFIMSYLLTLFIFPIIYIIFNWIMKNTKLNEK